MTHCVLCTLACYVRGGCLPFMPHKLQQGAGSVQRASMGFFERVTSEKVVRVAGGWEQSGCFDQHPPGQARAGMRLAAACCG